MTSVTNPPNALAPFPFPDHTQLPESNGTFVFAERAEGKNWQEHPQSLLLTDSITPILKQLNPEGEYCIGQDLGIYWRLTDPLEKARKHQIGFMSRMYHFCSMGKRDVLM
ncbi:hypothetical protein ANSO36C_36740 [Nostoc cf. commune SO-36]|uniref:Uma2 family endonuclease n=1 Tax=Nostoc cf. commune SO-36 TaxID=449208 RepID=A0ABN6Q907_NOSCO|nr:hypothetical protein ANSO36C_36740 [Nostoc cf. commune SO-36]